MKEKQYTYSDDETIQKAIDLIKKNICTEEETQKKFNLSEDDMDLIDFVINEY